MPSEPQAAPLPCLHLPPGAERLALLQPGERLLCIAGSIELADADVSLAALGGVPHPGRRLGEGEAERAPQRSWLRVRNAGTVPASCLLLPAPSAPQGIAAALTYYARWAAARCHPRTHAAQPGPAAAPGKALTRPCEMSD